MPGAGGLQELGQPEAIPDLDHLATAATSTTGQVDTLGPRGYDVRSPASEAAPGP